MKRALRFAGDKLGNAPKQLIRVTHFRFRIFCSILAQNLDLRGEKLNKSPWDLVFRSLVSVDAEHRFQICHERFEALQLLVAFTALFVNQLKILVDFISEV